MFFNWNCLVLKVKSSQTDILFGASIFCSPRMLSNAFFYHFHLSRCWHMQILSKIKPGSTNCTLKCIRVFKWTISIPKISAPQFLHFLNSNWRPKLGKFCSTLISRYIFSFFCVFQISFCYHGFHSYENVRFIQDISD